MVDIQMDKDGFLRNYPRYQKLPGGDNYNYSLEGNGKCFKLLWLKIK